MGKEGKTNSRMPCKSPTHSFLAIWILEEFQREEMEKYDFSLSSYQKEY